MTTPVQKSQGAMIELYQCHEKTPEKTKENRCRQLVDISSKFCDAVSDASNKPGAVRRPNKSSFVVRADHCDDADSSQQMRIDALEQ